MEKEQSIAVKILSTILAIFVILFSIAMLLLVPASCIKILFFN